MENIHFSLTGIFNKWTPSASTQYTRKNKYNNKINNNTDLRAFIFRNPNNCYIYTSNNQRLLSAKSLKFCG